MQQMHRYIAPPYVEYVHTGTVSDNDMKRFTTISPKESGTVSMTAVHLRFFSFGYLSLVVSMCNLSLPSRLFGA